MIINNTLKHQEVDICNPNGIPVTNITATNHVVRVGFIEKLPWKKIPLKLDLSWPVPFQPGLTRGE